MKIKPSSSMKCWHIQQVFQFWKSLQELKACSLWHLNCGPKLSGILYLVIFLPSDIMFGWIPFSRRYSAAFKSDPAKITTEVVPSPASTSWAFEISTSWYKLRAYHLGSRMDNIHLLENSGTIIGNQSLSSAIFDHLIHASRSQASPNTISNS